MKLHLLYRVFLLLAALPLAAFAQDAFTPTAGYPLQSGASQGIPWNHFSSPFLNTGFGTAGFGPFVPFGTNFGGFTPYGIDPSLHYHTYPATASSGPPPPNLNSGLPKLLDFADFPRRKLISPETWPSRGKILLQIPREASQDICYELDGFQYSAKPGFEQTFDDDRKWILTLSSNSDQVALRYTLTAGTYRFLMKNGRWDIGEVVPRRTDGGSGDYAPPTR